jgi:hypothetical protein
MAHRAPGASVKKLGDILQVVAFDAAGCPALLTGKELDAWIAYARELGGVRTGRQPGAGAPLLSQR